MWHCRHGRHRKHKTSVTKPELILSSDYGFRCRQISDNVGSVIFDSGVVGKCGSNSVTMSFHSKVMSDCLHACLASAILEFACRSTCHVTNFTRVWPCREPSARRPGRCCRSRPRFDIASSKTCSRHRFAVMRAGSCRAVVRWWFWTMLQPSTSSSTSPSRRPFPTCSQQVSRSFVPLLVKER